MSCPTLLGIDYWNGDIPLYINREKEAFTLPLHGHDFIEINFVAEGKGIHYIGDDRIEVRRGDLFIIPVGTTHVYRPTSGNSELIVYNCLFARELIERIRPVFPLMHNVEEMLSGSSIDTEYKATYKDTKHAKSVRYVHHVDYHDECRILLQSMYRESVLNMSGAHIAMVSMWVQLLLSIYRHWLGGAEQVQSHRLTPVLDYIAVHYQESISIGELAELAALSSPYLQRLFKEIMNQTIVEYIQNLRIEKCCELLRHTDLQVQDVAFQVGYKDMKYFHQLFKKKTGTSPLRYKKTSR